MLLKKSREVAPEGMKRRRQSGNNAQLWMCRVVNVKSGCCKNNVRSTNQGNMKVVKQEMARVNIDILVISELQWTRMGEFNSDDPCSYYCGQESLRKNGVALIVNKSSKCSKYAGAASKMTE